MVRKLITERIQGAIMKYYEKHSKNPSLIQLNISDFKKCCIEQSKHSESKLIIDDVSVEGSILLEPENLYLID